MVQKRILVGTLSRTSIKGHFFNTLVLSVLVYSVETGDSNPTLMMTALSCTDIVPVRPACTDDCNNRLDRLELHPTSLPPCPRSAMCWGPYEQVGSRPDNVCAPRVGPCLYRRIVLWQMWWATHGTIGWYVWWANQSAAVEENKDCFRLYRLGKLGAPCPEQRMPRATSQKSMVTQWRSQTSRS